MIEHKLENIEDIYNPLKNKLPQIIEYFVKFYGEEYRSQIKDRIDNTIFIFADREVKNSLNEHFIELKDELALKFEIEVENGLGYEVVNDVVSLGDYLLKLMPKVKLWSQDIKLADADELYSLFEIIKIDGLDTEGKEKFDELLKDENAVYEIERCLREVSLLYETKYKNDLEYLDSEQARIVQKGYKSEFEKIDKAFLEGVQEAAAVIFIKNFKIEMAEEHIKILNDMAPELIEYLLKEPKFYTQYDKDILNRNKEKLLEMSQFEGLDVQNLKARLKEIKSSSKDENESVDESEWGDLIEQIATQSYKQLKEEIAKLYEKRNSEISDLSSGFHSAKEYLLKEIIDGKRHNKEIEEFIKTSYEDGKRVSGIDAITVDRQNRIINFVCNESFVYFFDDVLVHELNHCVTSFAQYNGREMFVKTGIVYDNQMCTAKGSFYSYEGTMERYRMLNEAVNEYLTSMIYEEMEKDNFTIGLQGYSMGTSIYRTAFPLLQRFFAENIDKLKECSMSNDPNLPYETFGRENLDMLAKAVRKVLTLDSKNDSSYKNFLDEVEYMAGSEVDLFKLAKDESREWSKFTEEYLDCFALAQEAIDNIQQRNEQTFEFV